MARMQNPFYSIEFCCAAGLGECPDWLRYGPADVAAALAATSKQRPAPGVSAELAALAGVLPKGAARARGLSAAGAAAAAAAAALSDSEADSGDAPADDGDMEEERIGGGWPNPNPAYGSPGFRPHGQQGSRVATWRRSAFVGAPLCGCQGSRLMIHCGPV